jgi:hypothetical protein
VNLIDVTRELSSDEACLAFLEKQRWPDGIVRCPTCGCSNVSKIERKPGRVIRGKTEGEVRRNKRTRIYQCLEPTCREQFSATNGTIFHSSHLPLQTWFMAVALVMDAKKGISAKQLQGHLGIGSYKTAWYMCHRIRKAMAVETDPFDQLRGIVELDETFIGGKTKDRFGRARNRKPRAEKFDMVLGMRERTEKGGRPGRVKLVHIPDGKKETIRAAVQKHVVPSPTRLYTDDASIYNFAFDCELRKKHRSVNHSIQWIVPGTNIHTNTIESAFSLLKRGLIGSFHRVSIKHLHRYLSEFEYRFNQRKAEDRFSTTVAAMLKDSPMPYKQLVSDGENNAK